MTLAIEATGLVKAYGRVRALDGVDLAVEPASIVGLLGPNGAGKTTLVRILATLLRPDAGSARVGGHDVVADADAVRALVGLTGQFAAVDADLTGRENLELVGRLSQLSSRQARARAGDLLDRFGLVDAGDRRAATYSGGMVRRLDLAASLVTDPEIVFLDEPTTGLDPASRRALWEIIRGLVDHGTTVLLTSQYLDEVDALAQRIVVIDHGHVIASGTAAELKDQVGGELLELRPTDPGQLAAAADALAGLGEIRTSDEDGKIAVALGDQRSLIADAVRRLDDAGIPLDDVGITRPTLDDVFFALTGQTTNGYEPHGDGDDPGQRPAPAAPGDLGRAEDVAR